ncbi:MAG: SelB C-terminal domain-containing protein, partial [Firmicutes bacterium]|nr:SelB C-terminal domain-containing protein [Bacillota bacterium]
TLGGGVVADPHGHYKRGQAGVAVELEAKLQGGQGDLVMQAMAKAGLAPLGAADVSRLLSWPEAQAAGVLQDLASEHQVLAASSGEGQWYWHPSVYKGLQGEVRSQLQAFYRGSPLRWGMPKEELRRRLMPKAEARVWNLALAQLQSDGVVGADRDRVALAGRTVELTPAQSAAAQALEERFAQGGFSPPSPREAMDGLLLKAAAAEEILQYLLDQQVLVKVAEDLVFHRDALEEARRRVAAHFTDHQRLNMGDFRDMLGTTRKYAVPLLEYFDSSRFTRRVGDDRVLVG